MKKFLNWLFADFLYNLYEKIGTMVCSHIVLNHVFGLFRVNAGNPGGIPIPNTDVEVSDPVLQLQEANPVPFYSVLFQLTGNATIDIADGDTIELRRITGPDITTVVTSGSATRASLNITKVGDPIIP